MALIGLAGLLGGGGFDTSIAVGQDNPFGDGAGGNPFGEPAGGGDPFGGDPFGGVAGPGLADQPLGNLDGGFFDADDSDEADDNPLVNQLLESSARGNLQLAESIASLARIGRWKEVDLLLGRVAGGKFSGAQAAAMASRIGPSIYLKIKTEDQVSEASKAALDQLAAAAKTQTQSADRLRKSIAALGSESKDQQLAAARTLLRGGNASVVELAAAAVADPPPADRDAILRVLLRFELGGPATLRQLALYGSDPVRAQAVDALGRFDAKTYAVDLVTSLHATDASEAEVNAAARSLRRLTGSLPTTADAVAIALDDLDSKRRTAVMVGNDEQTETVWNVTSERTGVSPIETRAMIAAYRDVVDAGRRVRRLGVASAEINSQTLSSELAYNVIIDPDWGDSDQVDAIVKTFGAQIDESSLLDAISMADQTDDEAALVGLLRLIDHQAERLAADALLRSAGDRPTSLVQAATHSSPRVRFEATRLAAKLGAVDRYSGSTRVRQTLAEMTRLDDRPNVVLVETREEWITHLENLLSDMGFQVEVATNVRALQRAIDRGGDLRLIMAKTQLSDLGPIEMLDLVRRLPRGKDVPVVFHSDRAITDYGDQREQLNFIAAKLDRSETVDLGQARWTAPAIKLERPASPSALANLFESVAGQRRLPALSAQDRRTYRNDAAGILGRTEPLR